MRKSSSLKRKKEECEEKEVGVKETADVHKSEGIHKTEEVIESEIGEKSAEESENQAGESEKKKKKKSENKEKEETEETVEKEIKSEKEIEKKEVERARGHPGRGTQHRQGQSAATRGRLPSTHKGQGKCGSTCYKARGRHNGTVTSRRGFIWPGKMTI